MPCLSAPVRLAGSPIHSEVLLFFHRIGMFLTGDSSTSTACPTATHCEFAGAWEGNPDLQPGLHVQMACTIRISNRSTLKIFRADCANSQGIRTACCDRSCDWSAPQEDAHACVGSQCTATVSAELRARASQLPLRYSLHTLPPVSSEVNKVSYTTVCTVSSPCARRLPTWRSAAPTLSLSLPYMATCGLTA